MRCLFSTTSSVTSKDRAVIGYPDAADILQGIRLIRKYTAYPVLLSPAVIPCRNCPNCTSAT